MQPIPDWGEAGSAREEGRKVVKERERDRGGGGGGVAICVEVAQEWLEAHFLCRDEWGPCGVHVGHSEAS